MKVCGIIAEYNPFHNGHLYHMEESRRRTGADYLIVVLSGSFVQRGEPAFFDKYSRARMALLAGADLVLELPALFSCASAEDFAGAGISLLDKLGVVDAVAFGTEAHSLVFLQQAARILAQEPPEFSARLTSLLKEGLTYPQARAGALKACCEARGICWDKEAAASSNNILALEYLKALFRRQSAIKPVSIPRLGEGYHSMETEAAFCSATAVRAWLNRQDAHRPLPEGETASQLAAMTPDFSARILAEQWGQTGPLLADDFSDMLAYQLLSGRNHPQGFTLFADVSEELSRRILAHVGEYRSVSQWLELLKTRQYTRTRIARCLCHILLQIPEELAVRCRAEGYLGYARILGFRKDSAPLLTAIKQNAAIPLISKLADAAPLLTPDGARTLQTELFASQLAAAALSRKFSVSADRLNDYRAGLVIL